VLRRSEAVEILVFARSVLPQPILRLVKFFAWKRGKVFCVKVFVELTPNDAEVTATKTARKTDWDGFVRASPEKRDTF
jgi:hypothetical protein